MEKNLIGIESKDLYQLLITTCRYAYGRNNHLVPSSTYDQVLRILKDFKKEDEEFAIRTAQQLCEECISQEIMVNFYDGLDDEFGNLKESRQFVRDLLTFVGDDWEPYNYDLFLRNLELDNKPRYNIYKLVDGKPELIKEGASQNNFFDYMIGDKKAVTYNKYYNENKITYRFNDGEMFVREDMVKND